MGAGIYVSLQLILPYNWLKNWLSPTKLMGEKWKQWQILFSWAPKSLQMVTAATKLKDTYSLRKKL